MQRPGTCLWFDGQAEEAARFYVSLLPNSHIEAVVPYVVETPGGKPGDIMLVEFTLNGAPYVALNGGSHFNFNPAISIVAPCDDQAEIDRLWDALTEGGTPIQCGWITDRFGVSWQVVPTALFAMVKSDDTEKAARAMSAMMEMVKIDLAAIEAAYHG